MTVFERLRQLEANACPAPWVALFYDSIEEAHAGGEWEWCSGATLKGRPAEVYQETSHGTTGLPGNVQVGENDAEFIVAARNLWGPLVAVAEAAERRVRLEPAVDLRDGLRNALAALERAVKEQP